VAGASTALAVGAALAVVLQRYISTMPHLIAGLHNTVHLKALLLGALGFVSAVTICAITRHVCNNNDQKNQLLHLQVLTEVVLGPFVSASSSLLDPCLTCYRSFPCGVPRAIFARAPGLPPTGKTYPTPRNSILPSTFLLVLLDQRFAIDPCLPSLLIFMRG